MSAEQTLSLICFFGCHRPPEFFSSGLWQLKKVDIYKDGKLKTIVNPSAQYWKLPAPDRIEILEEDRVTTILRLRRQDSLLTSFDTTGHLKDSFRLRQLARDQATLTATTQIKDDSYTIVYNLRRIKDTSAGNQNHSSLSP